MGNLMDVESDIIRREYDKKIRRTVASHPHWRGTLIAKYPGDMVLYAEQIFANRPGFIVETGTRYGGASVFFADMLFLTGGRGVISIDIHDWGPAHHPMVTYLIGQSSVDPDVVAKVWRMVDGASVMVVLDSEHSWRHVYAEIRHYGRMVTPGQFLVVEDCYRMGSRRFTPMRAKEKYLSQSRKFKEEAIAEKFVFAVTRSGWLRKQ